MTVPAAAAGKAGRGRPPDRDLESRVYRATLDLYGEVGWAGFSFDLIARRARVGKAALYGRWAEKETLILAALRHGVRSPSEPADTGSIRTDLLALGTAVLDSYVNADGLVMLRAHVEAKVYPRLGLALEEWQRRDLVAFRPMLVRAVERGEVPERTSLSFVLDALVGALVNHILWTPIDKLRTLPIESNPFVLTMVDFVLGAVGYRAPLDKASCKSSQVVGLPTGAQLVQSSARTTRRQGQALDAPTSSA